MVSPKKRSPRRRDQRNYWNYNNDHHQHSIVVTTGISGSGGGGEITAEQEGGESEEVLVIRTPAGVDDDHNCTGNDTTISPKIQNQQDEEDHQHQDPQNENQEPVQEKMMRQHVDVLVLDDDVDINHCCKDIMIQAEQELIQYLDQVAQETTKRISTNSTSNNSSSSSISTSSTLSTTTAQSSVACIEYSRMRCPECNGSRSIYCADCCRILIPRTTTSTTSTSVHQHHQEEEGLADPTADSRTYHQWPQPIQNGTLRLPFQVDIIFDDRKPLSTGIQLVSILKETIHQSSSSSSSLSPPSSFVCDDSIRLIDYNNPHVVIPDYATEMEKVPGTYLLFPDSTSRPLSSVLVNKYHSKQHRNNNNHSNNNNDTNHSTVIPVGIQRLVVLDCKWSQSRTRFHPSILQLPRLHLDSYTPKTSYYWRWHNAGIGMISTLEAVYYSAWYVAKIQEQWDVEQMKQLVYLFWLFGIKREYIRLSYEKNAGKTFPHLMPFTEEGKEYQRSLRRKQLHAVVTPKKNSRIIATTTIANL